MLPQNQLNDLKKFVALLRTVPETIYHPDLDFFKEYLLSLGANLPPKPEEGEGKEEKKKDESEPMQADEQQDESKPESDPESEVELDMTGVIEADSLEPHEMGDREKKELTDEDLEAFDAKRSEAMAAYSDGEWEKAIDLFTEAIKINPGSAAMFAKRGSCFLKIQKPNACIRDCDLAIQINPDNATAYKFRGRAHRLLGNFMEAARDLRTACKIDFDEQADEWLKEVTPNAKKLEEHERKKKRRAEERELREKKERIRKAQEARAKAAEEAAKQQANMGSAAGEMPGGMGGMGGLGGLGGLLNDPELMASLSDPEVAQAFQDITSNPANIMKYQGNPKIMKLITKMATKMGAGGAMGGMGGMGGMAGMAGMGGFPAPPPHDSPPPAASSATASSATAPPPKPPSSSDDLD